MRHVGWRRLKGGDRPDLLDLGRKMLGYLENQKALGGAQTLSIQRELPDGSIVFARWLGDLPELLIREGSGAPPSQWIDGFSCRVTTAARSSWNGGGYGTGPYETANYRMQVLLARPVTRTEAEFDTAWYDENTLWWPGLPAPERFYRPIWGDQSLWHVANLDWQGDAGVLQFFGPNIRSGTDFWWQFDRYVLHNGIVLLDLNNTTGVTFSVSGPDTVYVLGAALAGTMEQPTELRVVVGERETDDSLEMTIRVVTTPVSWVGNRLETRKDGSDTVLTDRGSYEIEHMSGQTACVFFNQRGDEARTLMPRLDDTDSEITRYTEIVAARTGTGGFAFSATDHAVPVEESTQDITTTGTVGMATGSIETQYGSNVFPDSGSGITDIAGTTTETIEYADNGWFKVSVDYRDNVPVYLEHKRKHGTRERETIFSRSVIATDPGELADIPGSTTSGPVQLAYDGGSFAKWSVGGGYVNGETWAPSGTVEAEAVMVTSQEYTSSYRTDFLQVDAVDAESTTITYTQTITATGDYFGNEVNTEARDQSIETETVRPLYIDLRSRLWTYQRKLREVVNGSTTTVTKDYGTTGDSSEFTKRTQFTGPSTTTETWNTVFTCNGVTVEDTQTEQQTTSSSDSDVTVTPAAGWGTWWTEPSMYARLVSVLGDAREAGYSLSVDPYTTEPEYVVPGTNWAFYGKDFGLVSFKYSIGSWVASRNLVAYSYPVKTFNGGIVLAPAAGAALASDFVSGLCTTAGVAAGSLADLTFDDGSTVRYFPIQAVSPFRA